MLTVVVHPTFKILKDGSVQIPADNKKLQLGASQDLQIYHDGNNTVIDNNTGNLYVQSEGSILIQGTNNESAISYITNGAVELFFDNSKKFETLSDGVNITGTLKESYTYLHM